METKLLILKKNWDDFENFLIRFLQLESVPLQTRHDFVLHIFQHGIDEKAEKFISATLENLAAASQKKVDFYDRELREIDAKIKSLPQFRTEKISAANEKMLEIAENFKKDFLENQQKKSARAEKFSRKSATKKIDEIKKNLGI